MEKLYTFRRTLSATALLMMSAFTWAYNFQVNGIHYIIDDTGMSATVYYVDPGYSGTLVIPEKVVDGDTSYPVTAIENHAFTRYDFITSIEIPSSVTSIGNYAFGGSSSLISITVDADNPVYDSREGCNAIIETASNTLIAGCNNTIIPKSVTRIGECAFFNCSSLTYIYIPMSVTSIRESAFAGCTSLTSIEIPESTMNIGDHVFDGCLSLKSAKIHGNVTSIGEYTFSNCESLTYVELPMSVTSIGDFAISDCESLTSISIPSNVTSIGVAAFQNNSSLTSMSIPNSVTSIGNMAFSSCFSLVSFICYAENVPELGYHVFANVPTHKATLYVPAPALEDYKAADQWKDFGTILPIEETADGIETIGKDIDDNSPYYTIDGKRVDNPTQKGIYIKNGKKVLVK